MSNHFQDDIKNISILRILNEITCCSIQKEEYEIVFVFKRQKPSKSLSTQLCVDCIRGKT